MPTEFDDAVNPFDGAVNPFEDGGGEFADATNPFEDAVNPFGPDLSRSEFPDEAPQGELTWGDLGRSVMAGGAEVGAGMGWLADRAGEMTGIETLEKGGEWLQQRSHDSADTWRSGLSDYAGQVEQQTFLEEDEDSWTGYKWGDAGWDKVKLMLGQSLLGTAAGMGAGAAATAGLKVIPGVSAGLAATLGYSGGEALVAAPSSGAAAEEEVRRMTPEDLAGHVEYESLLLTDTPPEEAKEILAKAAGGDAAMMTAISTALLSGPFGKYLDKAVGGEAGSLSGGLLKGGATEATQETFQSGAEQMSVNAAMLEHADADRGLMEGVPEAMVGGAAAGGVMGAALGGPAGYAEGNRQHQADLDARAEQAAAEAREAGGDALDAENARAEVFAAGEAVAMPTDPEYMPDAGEDIVYNPFQETLREPIQTGPIMAEDGFADDNSLPYAAPESGDGLELAPLGEPITAEAADNTIDYEQRDTLNEKAGAIESAMEQYSYDQLGPKREPLEPVDPEQTGEPTIPARQEAEQAQLAGMEQELADAQKAVPAKPKGNQKAANEDMEILQAIASAGGLSREEAEAQGIDPAAFDTRSGGISRVFTNKGRSFDQMAEHMAELGFQGENYSANELVDQVTRSLGGEDVYSPNSKTAAERQASLENVARVEQEIANFQANSLDDENDPPKGKTYNALDDDERRIAYTAMEAELAGVDEFTIDYLLDAGLEAGELEQALREKITNVKRQQEHLRSPQADQGGNEGDQAAPSGAGPAQEGGSQEGEFQLEVEQDGTTPDVSTASASGADLSTDSETIDNTREFQQRQIDVDDTQELNFDALVEESDERSKRTIDHINDTSTPTIFQSENGKLFYTVTPPANGNNKYQVTVWDENGPVSDSKHDTAEGIDRHYRGELAKIATEQELNALTTTAAPATTPKKVQAPAQEKESDAYRAKPGGEMGLNGEWYDGGQFMPASARTKKGAHKFNVGKGRGKGRVLLAPGWYADKPEGYRPVFQGIREFISYDNLNLSDAKITAHDDTLAHYDIDRADLQAQVDALREAKYWQDPDGGFHSTQDLEKQFGNDAAKVKANETGQLVATDEGLVFPQEEEERAAVVEKKADEAKQADREAEKERERERRDNIAAENDKKVDAARKKLTRNQAEAMADDYVSSFEGKPGYDAEDMDIMRQSYLSGLYGDAMPPEGTITYGHPNFTVPQKTGWRDILAIAEGDTSRDVQVPSRQEAADRAKDKKKAEAELADATITEEFEDEDGNIVEVEQALPDALRQMDKRLEVVDQLLGCLLK